MSEAVLEDREGAVALLTLNRPDRMNAWNGDLETAYWGALDRAAADPDVRVIVVTGAGRAFCAGADMDMLQDIGGGVDGAEVATPRRRQTHTLSVPKPVIAAINGACAGIGMVQALMCDLRIAAAGAKFTTAFARRGLVAEHGMSWILPRLIGPARALDLLLSGRVFLADEAAALGIVNRVVPPEHLLDETLAYAAELATYSSPTSMAAMKRQVYGHLDADLDDAYTHSARLMAASLRGQDFKEGVASFVEKREPAFPPVEPGSWATGL